MSNQPMCKGAYELGTACGKCARCRAARPAESRICESPYESLRWAGEALAIALTTGPVDGTTEVRIGHEVRTIEEIVGIASLVLVHSPEARGAKAAELSLTLTRELGMYGQAFDGPGPRRAYTYEHQPDSIGAYRLGLATITAAAAPAGDALDRGLALLKALQAKGFGVFQVEATPPTDGDDRG